MSARVVRACEDLLAAGSSLADRRVARPAGVAR